MNVVRSTRGARGEGTYEERRSAWRAPLDDAVVAAMVEAAVRKGNFDEALGRVGNDRRHSLLWHWFETGLMTSSDLAGAILHAWDHGPKAHSSHLGERRWVQLFTYAGFVASPSRQRPEGSFLIFRGAPTATRGRGMSWTTDRGVADWFRDRWIDRGVRASTWQVNVPPSAVLAFDDERDEAEVIVDPDRLPPLSTPRFLVASS
jgi:hypothetical protein